uniref:IP06306p n=1 Tax=Drosophila melanogaster TaxID=7227 RepID=Q4V605_DROME|nr:IP06306p [Drosophila melanogaster]
MTELSITGQQVMPPPACTPPEPFRITTNAPHQMNDASLTPGRRKLQKWLGRVLRIVITDGRAGGILQLHGPRRQHRAVHVRRVLGGGPGAAPAGQRHGSRPAHSLPKHRRAGSAVQPAGAIVCMCFE